MMVMPLPRVVSDVSYVKTEKPADQAPQDYLRLSFENGEQCLVQNGGWTVKNRALAVMAFLGVSPSTLDEAEGKTILVAYVGRGGLQPVDMVIESGRELLMQQPWCPPFSDEKKIPVEGS